MINTRIWIFCFSFISLSVQAQEKDLAFDTYEWIDQIQHQIAQQQGWNDWTPHPSDPYQGFNRTAFAFNQSLDTWLLKPLAQGYRSLPTPVQTGTHNFLNNVSEPLNMLHCLLQTKLECTGHSLLRFVFNSTFGLLGLLDVASEMGIGRQEEDLGQTLVYWGVPQGDYLVVPFLGPSTLTNALAGVTEISLDSLRILEDEAIRNEAMGIKLVDKRASLLPATDWMEEQKLDAYSFMKESYLQIRRNQYFDGHPPRENSLDDFNLDDSDLQLKLN
jgi:phospholipid-binding lipoprotein MlaA